MSEYTQDDLLVVNSHLKELRRVASALEAIQGQQINEAIELQAETTRQKIVTHALATREALREEGKRLARAQMMGSGGFLKLLLLWMLHAQFVESVEISGWIWAAVGALLVVVCWRRGKESLDLKA